jgi:hypothetical protein
MIRFLHLLAIVGLIGSAGYAYSIKYETLYWSEQVGKLKTRIQKEREGIAVLKAEWQHLNRPDRLQAAVGRHLDLQPMTVHQLARLSDLPNRSKVDEIGRKLEALGLLQPTTTPKERQAGDPRTTGSTTPSR